MATLDNVKVILGIQNFDYDDVLELYITRANDFVMNYCNITDLTTIPYTLSSVIEDIVVYMFQNRGSENLQSETLGSRTSSFLSDIPANLISQLNANRRLKIV